MTSVEDESGFGITLQPGWNQVGNPYNFELSWDDVIALNDGNENISQIKLYENGLLSEENFLPAFRGGFVFLNGDQSILIKLPPNPSFKNGNRIGDLAWKNNRDIGGDSWFLPLTLSSGRFTSSIQGLGMHPGSEQGFDRYDEPLLPVPAEISGFEMYFPHEGELYDRISRDIVSPAGSHTWEFEVNKSGGSGNMTFSWENETFGNNNFTLILHDEAENRVIDMRTVKTYTFHASGVRKFRVLYGTSEFLKQEIMPLSVHVGEIYPNPFSEELFVPISLPDIDGQYQVDIALSDLNGNLVQQLSSVQVGGGYQNISCEALKNVELSKGFYIIRIHISSEGTREILYRKVLKY
jgi:hypothetical protein